MLALVVWIGQGPPQPGPASDQKRYHDRVFTVVRVVDGDTFDIDVPDGGRTTTRIRLWGVDCPETAHDDQPAMHFGAEATAFTIKALAGQSVHLVLVPDKTRGLYGRLLAYAYLERGQGMLNEMLIERGYAYADPRFDHPHARRFKALDERARKAGVGLWAEVSPDQMPPWKQRFERWANRK